MQQFLVGMTQTAFINFHGSIRNSAKYMQALKRNISPSLGIFLNLCVVEHDILITSKRLGIYFMRVCLFMGVQELCIEFSWGHLPLISNCKCRLYPTLNIVHLRENQQCNDDVKCALMVQQIIKNIILGVISGQRHDFKIQQTKEHAAYLYFSVTTPLYSVLSDGMAVLSAPC